MLLGNKCIIFETPTLSQNTGHQFPIDVAPDPKSETSTAFPLAKNGGDSTTNHSIKFSLVHPHQITLISSLLLYFSHQQISATVHKRWIYDFFLYSTKL